MTKIALVAPNEEIEKNAVIAKEKFVLDMDIHVGLMNKGYEMVGNLIKSGAKVIISRGGTALFIKQKSTIPVVEIKMTLDDVVKALEEAKKHGNKFLFIGFSNHLQGLESLGPLLGLDVQQIIINDWHEAELKILEAKSNGTDVIIGGAIQCQIAEKNKIKSVFLKSGIHSIYNAYNEAETMLEVLLNEERKIEEIKALLDNTAEGFIAIDKAGKITLINKTASSLLNCKQEDVIGKNIECALPDLSNLTFMLKTPNPRRDDVVTIGKNMLLYSKIPLHYNDEIIGAMATLRDAKRLSEEESKVRVKQYSNGLYARYHFEDILGCSKNLVEAKRIALRYSKSHFTVLIISESGTGKEMFAQSIHNSSPWHRGPFVAINCMSLAPSILESELFGYVEGAFSGAKKGGKMGVFEMAHGGTIFLDEVGEISPSLQEKLLRVLQERCVMRLGDDKIIPIEVRVIAATNKNLVDEMRKGHFRQDLFFRLNVLRIQIPPLRERKDDIITLANFFLEKYAVDQRVTISQTVEALLKQYSWPGNIRELENLMERLSIISTQGCIKEHDIYDYFHELEGLTHLLMSEKNLQREEVERILESVNENKTKAAAILGVHRSTLWRFLNKKEQE